MWWLCSHCRSSSLSRVSPSSLGERNVVVEVPTDEDSSRGQGVCAKVVEHRLTFIWWEIDYNYRELVVGSEVA